jgi:hypothetical protein
VVWSGLHTVLFGRVPGDCGLDFYLWASSMLVRHACFSLSSDLREVNLIYFQSTIKIQTFQSLSIGVAYFHFWAKKDNALVLFPCCIALSSHISIGSPYLPL